MRQTDYPRPDFVTTLFSHRWQFKASYITPGVIVVAAIAIAVALWLLVSPPAQLKAQANSAPTITAYSTPNSVTAGISARFSATATDPDGNIIKWEWSLGDVQQREYTFNPQSSATRLIDHIFPTAGDYTLKSTFTDAEGESASHTWDVEVADAPSTVTVAVASRPAGRTVTVDGTDRTAPYTAAWDSGSTHSLNAPSPQRVLGVTDRYVFSSWGHGGAQSQSVAPTSDTTYTANFTQQHFLSTATSIPGGGQWYDHNSEAFVGPAPDRDGYAFSHWEKGGQNIGTDQAGVTVTVDASFRVDAVYTVAVTVQFGAAEYTVTEGDGEVEVTVTISASPSEEVYLRFRTRDGTAESPQDFLSVFSSLVSFPRDTTTLTQTVSVTIIDNVTVEAAEAFTVALEAPSFGLPTYVRLTRSEATVTILDNDEATVAFTQNRLSFSEDQRGVQIEVGVQTDPQSSFCPATFPFDVHFSYTDPDGALSSESTIPSLVRFETCQSVRTFDIDSGDLAGIGVVTGTTEVVFTLDRVTSGADGTVDSRVTVGEPSTLTVAIQDADEASVRWQATYRLAREREQYGPLCVIIEDEPSVSRPFTVHFSYTDPAGVLSSVSQMPSSVTFGAGDQEACVNEFDLGDAPYPSAEVVFTLDRVTSAGSDVASRVTIRELWSMMTLEVFDQDDPMPTNSVPSITGFAPSTTSLSLSVGDQRTFEATASDPDDNLEKFEWFVNGRSRFSGALSLTGPATRRYTYTFSTPRHLHGKGHLHRRGGGVRFRVLDSGGRRPILGDGQRGGRFQPIGTHGHGGRDRPENALHRHLGLRRLSQPGRSVPSKHTGQQALCLFKLEPRRCPEPIGGASQRHNLYSQLHPTALPVDPHRAKGDWGQRSGVVRPWRHSDSGARPQYRRV